MEEEAREFARTAHERQPYGEESFFDSHLTQMVAILKRFGEDNPTTLAAGWLHDVLEDTDVSLTEIRQKFGNDVADLVWRLTDVEDGSRRERQEKTHRKIRGRTEAVRIKLADRIANVEACIRTQSPLLSRMYRKEHGRFLEHLYQPGEYEEMWQHLNHLLA